MAAEIILTPVAELIIEHLGSAAVKEIGLLWGVKDEFEKLNDTLLTIKAVLRDAEKRQVEEYQVKAWLQRLEDVVSEADDLLDEVATEGLRRQSLPGKKLVKEVCAFFSPSNQLVFRHKMAHKIRKIRESLAEISADREHFHFVERREETKLMRKVRDDSHSFVVEGNIVGRDKDRRALVALLLGPKNRIHEETISVIPIVGMGGLGKTTLAQLVFNDERVQQHFELKIWVCVSNDFDVKVLCEKIIKTATDERIENLEMEKLQRKLREKLNGKRYLLVLDDVWNNNPQIWRDLKGLLANCVEGSRVIVTTRSEMVAKLTAGSMQPYRLTILNQDDSWCLFKKVAFDQGQDLTNSSVNVEIAQEVAKKCGGVPLAISMIGSMLFFRGPDLDWGSFLEKELSNIPQEENYTLSTLKLSYDDLPLHLKPCFAYCSLLPKDHKIEVETLILLWIAQGFIRSSNGSQTIEDVGYEYFMDLYWRSFFQEAERDELNKIMTCKMHGLVRDLAIHVAGKEYQRLASSSEDNIHMKVHHVSLGYFNGLPSSLLQAKRLRSFLLNEQYNYRGRTIGDQIVSNFTFIRMLTLHQMGFKRLPNSIGKLKHLRYLDLSNNDMETLPASITKLVNLQTLKLNQCRRLCELPSGINKLVNLRHLDITSCCSITHMPSGLSELTNLQTLPLFVLSNNVPSRASDKGGKSDKLMGFNNLRGKELRIIGIRSGMETTVTKLRENKYLRSLHLGFKRRDNDADSEQEWKRTLLGLELHPNLRELTLDLYGGASLYSLLSPVTKLVKLILSNCTKCKHIPSLHQFHSLKEMRLYNFHALKYIAINEGDGYFAVPSLPAISVLPSLQKLTLASLPNFIGWWNSDMAENRPEKVVCPLFPRLSSLEIKDCPKLTSMPCYPNIEGELYLTRTSGMHFEQTVTMRNASPSPSSVASSSTTSLDFVSFFPLSKLTALFLNNVVDLQYLPDEYVKSLVSLKKLNISKCPRLKYLSPEIQHPISLEELSIFECDEFEVIKWPGSPFTSLRIMRLTKLPRLKYLQFRGIQYPISLEKLDIDSCDEFEAIKWPESPILTSLCMVRLSRLPKLKYLQFQGIQYLVSVEELYIFECDEFEAIKWPESPVLTNLRILRLLNLPKLKDLQSQGMQYLTSLEILQIKNCKELEAIKWPETPALTRLRILRLCGLPKLKIDLLSPGMQYLTSLEELQIGDCEELQVSKDDSINEWQALTSLRQLEFTKLPQLVTLPGALQFLTTLESLEIQRCVNFTALPDWISKLCSLQWLHIRNCPNFNSVPGAISNLSSLQYLCINDKGMDPREIREDLNLSCSTSGRRPKSRKS